MEGDTSLAELVRYIHRNPQEASLVERCDHYEWSSYRGYLSYAKDWRWLHKEPVLAMPSEYKNRQRGAYREFMLKEEGEELAELF